LLRNYLLQHVIEGQIKGKTEGAGKEEEDVSNYWTTFRKREGTGN